MKAVQVKSRAPAETAQLSKAIMLASGSAFSEPHARPSSILAKGGMRVLPDPVTMQAQLSKARCEVETLRTLKTENGATMLFSLSFTFYIINQD